MLLGKLSAIWSYGVGKLQVYKELQKNLEYLDKRLGISVSFDVLVREIKVGGKDAALVFLDGLVKDKETQTLMAHLLSVERGGLQPNIVKKLMEEQLPFFDVSVLDDLEEAINSILSGPLALLVDGMDSVIILDVRQYPTRGIEEPDLERVTRGARDGFVETGLLNVNLIRRRLRDPGLRFEAIAIGRRSKTDVFLGYIDDIADPGLVAEVRKRLENVEASALPMGTKNLEEYITGMKFNPFPVVRFTERPDVVVAHLLEGNIIIITDTTPATMILPATAWHFTQHAEDYFNNPVVGTYIRWLRFAAMTMAFLLTPVWLVLAQNRSMLPPSLQFVGPRGTAAIPLFVQFLFLEAAVDITRLAFIHTPNALSTSLGLVAAILLGDFAVKVGLFIPETILYQAITAIAYFSIPNYEFGMAARLFRLLTLVLTGLFNFWGLAVGITITFLVMVFTKSFGVPYLWPLIPLHGPSLLRLLFRYPIPSIASRPPFTDPVDSDVRQAKGQGGRGSDEQTDKAALHAALGVRQRSRRRSKFTEKRRPGQKRTGED